MDRAVFPALRATPDGPAEGSACRQAACGLRQAIAAGRYPARQRLPTGAELASDTGLSRQTVRRAFQELVTEGAIYGVRRRGTFAVQRPLEFAIKRFNPDRYSYRLQLRRVDPAGGQAGPR